MANTQPLDISATRKQSALLSESDPAFNPPCATAGWNPVGGCDGLFNPFLAQNSQGRYILRGDSEDVFELLARLTSHAVANRKMAEARELAMYAGRGASERSLRD